MPVKSSLREMKRRRRLLLSVFLFISMPLSVWAQKNSCLDCHLQMDDVLKAPAEGFAADVHKQFGLGCEDCHGGDPAQDDVELAKDRSFKGSPERAKIPEFCGSRHSDSAVMRKFNPNLRA